MTRADAVEILKDLEDLFREAYDKEVPLHIEYNDIYEVEYIADALEFVIGDMETMQDIMDIVKCVSED